MRKAVRIAATKLNVHFECTTDVLLKNEKWEINGPECDQGDQQKQTDRINKAKKKKKYILLSFTYFSE